MKLTELFALLSSLSIFLFYQIDTSFNFLYHYSSMNNDQDPTLAPPSSSPTPTEPTTQSQPAPIQAAPTQIQPPTPAAPAPEPIQAPPPVPPQAILPIQLVAQPQQPTQSTKPTLKPEPPIEPPPPPPEVQHFKRRSHTLLFIIIGIILALILLLYGIYALTQNLKKQVEYHPIQPTPTSVEQSYVPPSLPQKPKPIEGEVIIKVKPDISDEQLAEHLKLYNVKIMRKITSLNRFVLEVPKAEEDSVMQKLRDDLYIENVIEDYLVYALTAPNDPLYQNQWSLKNTGQIVLGTGGKQSADAKVEAAWTISQGAGVKVAVIDTGINVNHPDLAGKIASQKVFITNSIEDEFGHGTHIAGIIAAVTNNSAGVAGSCPACQLIVVKGMDDSGLSSESILAESIAWSADNGAKVINVSAGTTNPSSIIKDAADYAFQKGAVVVASAGNNDNSTPVYPAAFSNVVSVTATNNQDQKAYFSTYGSWVKLTSPGENILSTLPTHSYVLQVKKPGLAKNYDYLSGTSMATPLVSGIAALVWASPYGTSNTAVIKRLYDTADKIPGTGTYWAYGRINAARALGIILPSPTPTPSPFPTNIPSPTIAGGAQPTNGPFAGFPSPFCLGACPTSPSQPSTPPIATATVVPAIPTTLPLQPGVTLQPSSIPTSTIQPTQLPPIVINNPGSSQNSPTPTITPNKPPYGGSGDPLSDYINRLIAILKQLLQTLPYTH